MTDLSSVEEKGGGKFAGKYWEKRSKGKETVMTWKKIINKSIQISEKESIF